MDVPLASSMIEINLNGVCRIDQQEFSAVGFGTAHMKRFPELCFNSIKTAADLGYRILDTATRYQNFVPLGKALEGYDRRDFYIITKAWHDAQTASKLEEDLTKSLKQLNMDYVDAYFLHWPNSKIPIEESLYAIEELRRKKFIRHFGLSNVTLSHLKRALEVKVSIEWVQIEMSPFFYDPELIDFCKKNSIAVQASAPLHESKIDEDSFLIELAKKYGKTEAQISLRWILQHGCVSLPRSGNPAHIQSNKEILDFTITEEDMQKINEKAKHGTRKIRVTGEAATTEGFTDEFDFSYEQCWPKNSNSR